MGALFLCVWVQQSHATVFDRLPSAVSDSSTSGVRGCAAPSRANIYLVGLMAVGKTTVGRHLAEALDRPFFDSDREIEARAGAEISWIFDVEGEDGFRDREEQVIDELTKCDGIVMATGGGAVLRDANRRHLRERGTVIHLDSSTDRLVERTSRDRKRPLLQGGNARAVFERLRSEREPLYEAVRHYRFMPVRGGPKALASQIASRLRKDGIID